MSVVRQLKQSLEQDEKCNIKGKIKLNRVCFHLILYFKVTGQLQFSFNNKLGYIQHLYGESPEIAKKLSLAHVMNSLTFGDFSQ